MKWDFLKKLSVLKTRLFWRIYGLTALFLWLMSTIGFTGVYYIQQYRAQEYRESLVDGVSYVISETYARLPTPQERVNWLSDASLSLGEPLSVITQAQAQLSNGERKRIEQQRAVVRVDEASLQVFVGIKDDPEHYLTVSIDSVNERQIEALALFVIDYLAAYPGNEHYYVGQISKHFAYDLELEPLAELTLDQEQIGRLKRYGSLVKYSDNHSISILAPIHSDPSKIVVLGEIPMFNEFPVELRLGILAFFILSVGFGVFALIRPLDRRIHRVNKALNRVQQGDLDSRLELETNDYAKDEIGILSSSFNNMADHINRLIEAQRELLRAVSHELRTPVARIRFALATLADEDDCDFRNMQLELIDKDIDEINKLIDEIITYTKLEQGMPLFDFEQIVLHDLLEQVKYETEALGTAKKIELQAPDATLQVEAEYRYLHRVVQNLVGNAIRYAATTVRISGGILKNGQAFVCVEDDGDGIPEEHRQRIFEAFARIDDSRNRGSGGYGLGLSIVGRIAYWFGGKVDVDSSPDLGGARFIMTWAAQRSSAKKLK